MIDIVRLLEDHKIPHATSGPNVSFGWIGVACPWCFDTSTHGGFSPKGVSFSCWRCGTKPLRKTIAKLLKVTDIEASRILKQYGGRIHQPTTEQVVRIGEKKFKFPSSTERMTKKHRQYLESRNFDAEKLEREWHLYGTGPISLLDDINYSHRIIAPIRWNNATVSFQARDITEKHALRYITCPKQRETVHHKFILYGRQEHWTDVGIVCEGITDVYRLGIRTCATFGIEYTLNQVREMKKHFRRVYVLYDCEEQAQEKGRLLCKELQFRGVQAYQIPIEDDPANMSQEDADKLVKSLH